MPERFARSKKRPHNLHSCANADELVAALGGLDLVSLAYEFVKPSYEVAVLVTGSIPEGTGNPLSDLDVLVLVSGPEAYKSVRRRDIFGSPVNYLPTQSPHEMEVSLFIDGIELDIIFVVESRGEGASAGNGASPSPDEDDDLMLATRLRSCWTIHGHDIVERWRERHDSEAIRIRWMAAKFTEAGKILEDMEAGIGRARGLVSNLGAHIARYLVSALLAFHHYYSSSPNWPLKVDQLSKVVDPEMSEALEEGVELAFPALLDGAGEERDYFDRVYAYCSKVRSLLAREEGMGEILASIIHDLDIILPIAAD